MRILQIIETAVKAIHKEGTFIEMLPQITCLNGLDRYVQRFVSENGASYILYVSYLAVTKEIQVCIDSELYDKVKYVFDIKEISSKDIEDMVIEFFEFDKE